jgi:hypothetical protein
MAHLTRTLRKINIFVQINLITSGYMISYENMKFILPKVSPSTSDDKLFASMMPVAPMD